MLQENIRMTFAQPIQPEGWITRKGGMRPVEGGSVPPFLVGVSKGGNSPIWHTTLRSKV